ncbi:hypothetical protein V9T40_009499 [Parthenolecanium corni]|uniref:FYVE-type domain-containing protein n=1 Tax=Parthenolecanium corni TaxID=536013 RepID=A0AAN9Y6S6_9HEMI
MMTINKKPSSPLLSHRHICTHQQQYSTVNSQHKFLTGLPCLTKSPVITHHHHPHTKPTDCQSASMECQLANAELPLARLTDLSISRMDLFPDYYPSSLKSNFTNVSPAIMESIDNPSLILNANQSPTSNHNVDLTDLVTQLECSKLNVDNMKCLETKENMNESFLLLNKREQLKFSTPEEFLKCLKCDENSKVKVVSIFGNTGDGKSFTLNECFFNGHEVFRTSSDQDSCTIGIWVAYDPNLKIICIDTEGLLGSTHNENQRTRLLLKVLAISDIVIYRTRSERLHRDLFTFLGTASRAYTHHFAASLQSVSQKTDSAKTSSLGPAAIIFHETRHTKILKSTKAESAEDVLRSKFAQLHLDIEAFSSLRYVGVQTIVPPTNFKDLRNAVIAELENTTVRSSRNARIVFLALKALNDKFSGDITSAMDEVMFPDQYFTCPMRCLSCDSRCSGSMGHLKENLPHSCPSKCRYEHQYGNCIYVCKLCYVNGKEVIVKPKYVASNESSWFSLAKYAWSGYLIECPHHGEIYRSRQFWFGNTDPEIKAVRSELHHVWPDQNYAHQSLQNSGQKVIDGVSYLSDAVFNVSSEPSKYVGSWVADKLAPAYWVPNSEITDCYVCQAKFNEDRILHHCRACGQGVCENCSPNNRLVPERGWTYPVRVCNRCINDSGSDRISLSSDLSSDDAEIRARKVSEAVVSTLSSVASIFQYPKSLIKDSARPTYWVPDDCIHHCIVCKCEFRNPDGSFIKNIHHCRDCGGGVCSKCSSSKVAVPHRGWDNPVRVCDKCLEKY